MRLAVLAVAMLATPVSVAAAGAWVEAASGPEGAVYRAADPEISAVIRVAPVDALEAACACSIDRAALNAETAALAAGLSILWIDAFDLEERREGGRLFVVADAETEDGARRIAAGYFEENGAPQLRVYLDAPDAFDAETAIAALSERWGARPPAPRIAARAPNAAATATKATPAKTPPTRAARGDYPAPENFADLEAWPQDGLARIQRPGDPASPRYVGAVTGPKYNVRDHDGAVRDLVKDTGIQFIRTPNLRPLAAWKTWDGRDMRMAFAESRLGGAKAVVFLLVSQEAGSDDFKLFAVEAPEATFRDWGGAARMMALRDIVPSVDVFPAEARAAIAAASLRQQEAFYEAALDKLLEQMGAAMVAMTQAQIAAGMTELNYDLLLGDDPTTSMTIQD